MDDKNIETMHVWKATDIPGYYICFCGCIGSWNRELQKVEVTQPMPYETYIKRHAVLAITNGEK